MQQSIVCFFFGLVVLVFFYSMTTASIISCPPNNIQQEINPKINQLCFALEQVLQDSSPQNEGYAGRLVDERNTNFNAAKRQDVDHVFLRFGRRFGL
ncbi:myosuppressin [Euwallacea similis]|uniref:myosuppressin n=1 Tax=Euwallacea similis TaxID=1736056 RepID=UPI00344C882B